MSGATAYFLGVVTGIALAAYHRSKVGAAIRQSEMQSRYEKDQLSDQLRIVTDQRDDLVRERDMNEAYLTGYEKGQLSPLSEAERLVMAFHGRNVAIVNTSKHGGEYHG